MSRKFKIKENKIITPCPKCGNNTGFVCHSQQVAEDYCNIWAVCKCGYDPTHYDEAGSGHRIEDVWGGCSDENCIDAVNISWNDAIEDLTTKTSKP